MVNGSVAYALQDSSMQEIEVAESPVKYCTVTLSDVISRGKRLEASVFDVEAKHARAAVENSKYPVTMVGGTNGLTISYVCGRFKRIWVEKSDLPIFQPSSITDIYPTPDGYISHKTQTNIDALRVHAGQVLMTCSGTIGKLSFVSKTLDNLIFSHDLLRINAKKPIDAGYVYAYLKSAIGNKILLTNSYGAVITHIEPEHLATVPIPDAPEEIKKRINNLIVASYTLRDESNALIDEATALLKEELHFPDIHDFNVALYKKDADVDTFSVKLSKTAGRVDASYHVPIVNAIVEHMKEYAAEVTTVGDKRISKEIILPGRFKRVYVEEGYGRVFIGGKQIHELDPVNKKYLSLVHHGDRISKQLELHEGMTLITCSGTIGKVTLVGKHWENWTANQHIIRVIPASKDVAGYLSVFLASEYGYPLITHYTYGSVVDEIDDNHVSSIPFPILKNAEVQQRINTLALQANEKRYEAYKLEQQALRIVDKEVIFAK
ncbi:MAG: restriction endonuclease subunit S [Clostridiales bacterium]|nr:restriction endonuclease subunit S [Clostridiales bacterium]